MHMHDVVHLANQRQSKTMAMTQASDHPLGNSSDLALEPV